MIRLIKMITISTQEHTEMSKVEAGKAGSRRLELYCCELELERKG